MHRTKKQLLDQMEEIGKELNGLQKEFGDIKKRSLSLKSNIFSKKDKKGMDDIRKKIGLL